jgi:hypothetical protein
MREAKFKIGDRVVVLPSKSTGKVQDCFYGTKYDEWSYEVCRDDTSDIDTYIEDVLEPAPERKDYSMTIQIDIAHNVLVASLFEKVGDDLVTLAKGHGHLIHEGELGIAQAASYACKRLYESLGGTLTK